MSSEDLLYITPTEVRDYLFCPAILYNKHVRLIEEPLTEMMRRGRERFEEDRRRGVRRRTLLGMRRIKPDKILYSQHVKSDRLRIHGIIDIIYWLNNRTYIVEIKDSPLKKVTPDHLYQTVAYALMAEETFNTIIYKINIFYLQSGKWIEKRMTKDLREYTIHVINETHKIIQGKVVPEIKYKNRCNSCWYIRICHPYTLKTKRKKRIISKIPKDTQLIQ